MRAFDKIVGYCLKRALVVTMLVIVAVLLSGCASYQLHKPTTLGAVMPTLTDNIRGAMVDAILIEHPTLTQAEAEAMARSKFIEYQPEVMTEYRRVGAALSLAARIAALLGG